MLVAILFLPIAGWGGGSNISTNTKSSVILGNEQFDTYIPLLEGKRVALFSNHIGIVGDVTSSEIEENDNEDNGDNNSSSDLIHFGLDANGNKLSYGEHILDALLWYQHAQYHQHHQLSRL